MPPGEKYRDLRESLSSTDLAVNWASVAQSSAVWH